jgi:hypothetical protein
LRHAAVWLRSGIDSPSRPLYPTHGIEGRWLRGDSCRKASGARRNGRTKLQVQLDFLRAGDTLVVTRIDRLARSLKDLEDILHELKARGVALKATEQPVDTGTAAGKAFISMPPKRVASIRVARRRSMPARSSDCGAKRGSGLRRSPAGWVLADRAFIGCWTSTLLQATQTRVRVPIKPEMRGFYPSDWPQISRRVRFERAAGICQTCGRPHGITIRCLPDGRWFDPTRHTWRNGRGRPARWPDLEETVQMRGTRIVLAAAHLDHDASNNRWRNLKSLCQRCHMIHDRPYHLAQRRITYLLRRALGDLFLGPYCTTVPRSVRDKISINNTPAVG